MSKIPGNLEGVIPNLLIEFVSRAHKIKIISQIEEIGARARARLIGAGIGTPPLGYSQI